MVRPDGELVVIDFGCAQDINLPKHVRIGTEGFMAPEVDGMTRYLGGKQDAWYVSFTTDH